MKIDLNVLRSVKGIGQKTLENIINEQNRMNSLNFDYGDYNEELHIDVTETTLLKGDSLELMSGIEDHSIDMVLTDPPYGMELKPQRKGAKFHGVEIKNDDNLLWTDSFFKSLYRVLKNDSGAFIFCNHYCISEFISSAKSVGFDIKNIIVWDKGHFGMGGNWRPVHELILLITKGRFVCKSKNLRNIVRFDKVWHSQSVHPTQKPVDLLEHLIEEPDYEPEVILDPFMGSGSTGVACKNLNRKFIGIEMDDNYFNIAKKRIIGD